VRAAYESYIPRIGREPGPMADDYAARIKAGEAFVTGDPIAGLIVLIDESDHLLLDNIAVDPAAQGQGIGRALLAFADSEARRRGHTELRLYTHEKMTENVALYARAGWTETHRATQNGFPRVFFRKPV
jgi:GNAT superfamily N-acetyltransferase